MAEGFLIACIEGLDNSLTVGDNGGYQLQTLV